MTCFATTWSSCPAPPTLPSFSSLCSSLRAAPRTIIARLRCCPYREPLWRHIHRRQRAENVEQTSYLETLTLPTSRQIQAFGLRASDCVAYPRGLRLCSVAVVHVHLLEAADCRAPAAKSQHRAIFRRDITSLKLGELRLRASRIQSHREALPALIAAPPLHTRDHAALPIAPPHRTPFIASELPACERFPLPPLRHVPYLRTDKSRPHIHIARNMQHHIMAVRAAAANI